ncbi:unnamed protein product, partial [Didymodactylos carnosus]
LNRDLLYKAAKRSSIFAFQSPKVHIYLAKTMSGFTMTKSCLFSSIFLILTIIQSIEGTSVWKKLVISDELCDIVETLCVRNELQKIRDALIKVNRIAQVIENHEFKHTSITGTLSMLIDNETHYLNHNGQIPKSHWENNFLLLNNIDRTTNNIHDTALLFYNTVEVLIAQDKIYRTERQNPIDICYHSEK